MLSVVLIDDIGELSDLAKVAVTDGAAVSYIITAGKKGCILMNVGGSPCCFGGSTVDADNNRGIIMLPRVPYFFKARQNFKIYFQCTVGLSTSIGIVEYD